MSRVETPVKTQPKASSQGMGALARIMRAFSPRRGKTLEEQGITSPKAKEDVWIPTVCLICNRGPDPIRVRRVDGVAVKVEGDPLSPKTQGKACAKAIATVLKLYDPYRLKGPLKRTNPEKGIGIDPKFVEITWDEALDTVAAKLKEIMDDPRQLICTSSDRGSATVSVMRGFGQELLGTPNRKLDGGGVRCTNAEHVIGNMTHGADTCEPDLPHCRYILIIGRNPMASGGVPENLVYSDARVDRAMKMVVLDPVLTVTAAKSDDWIPIKPGSDAAFVLAMINTILNEIGKWDAPFLKEMTNAPYLIAPDGHYLKDSASGKPLLWDSQAGVARAYDDPSLKDCALEGVYKVQGVETKPAFQLLKEHMKQYTAEWASEITTVPAETIRRVAREWVENACIGSTIEIDGLSLPYRPVATKVGRGVNARARSAVTQMAVHLLAEIVGALEVPGGHRGAEAEQIAPGKDGLKSYKIETWRFPPDRLDAADTLAPFNWWGAGHMYLLSLNNPEKLSFNYRPKVVMSYRNNPLLSIGDPKTVAEAIKKIPFHVRFAVTMDEMAEFADIVLTDPTDLERLEIFEVDPRPTKGPGYEALSLRQPVVEPLYNTREIADVCTELAARLGMMEKWNKCLNNVLEIKEPYLLTGAEKYPWQEIVNRHCLSLSKGKHDLPWFKEKGGVAEKMSAEQEFAVYLKMRRLKLRFPFYYEFVMKVGEELKANLDKVGIDWWDTQEYSALPFWVVPPALEDNPEYDLFCTTCRSMLLAQEANVNNPWIIEMVPHETNLARVLMNEGTARKKGIKPGDKIWIESPVGKVKGVAALSQGIRPDTIEIGGEFGQWATPLAKDTGWVTMNNLVPLSYEYTDRIHCAMEGHVVRVKVYKA